MNAPFTDQFQATKRFDIRRRIGAGGMGVVYQALDRERGEMVAIKTLHHVEAKAIYRLKREFRTLADLVHPNLVVLHELFSTGDQWFFSMEFVDGTDFLSYVRHGVPPGGGPHLTPEQWNAVTPFDATPPPSRHSTIGLDAAHTDPQTVGWSGSSAPARSFGIGLRCAA